MCSVNAVWSRNRSVAVLSREKEVEGRYVGEVTEQPEPFTAPTKARDAARFVEDFLREHGASERRAVMEAAIAAGHKEMTVRRTLKELVDAERIRQPLRGVYEPLALSLQETQ